LLNARDAGSSVVVIRGSAGNFCAGGDVVEFRDLAYGGESLGAGADILHRIILLIRGLDAIVITVIEGIVMGAGIGVFLASDLTVAAKSTIINMGYRRIGLTPDGGSSILLPLIVGAKRFNEMYLFSGNINMEKAKELGLINFVWGEEELEEKLERTIGDVSALPQEPIRYFKDLVNSSLFASLEDHLDKEGRYLSELGQKAGFKERLDAFLKKR
jgi:2-(1,2-epoxy-1,2-dihydrophenyl)acetyl-CoA isomerase